MADDLEAFLRQAAQRRVQRQATPTRPAPPAPPASAPPRAPCTPTPAAPVPSPAAKGKAPPTLPAAEPTRVGTRVNTAGFEQRAEHLGEEVGLADEHMDAHISQKFDHHVGSLGLDDSAQADPTLSDTTFDIADLVAMLKNPATLQQAVLLSEILTPPHIHR